IVVKRLAELTDSPTGLAPLVTAATPGHFMREGGSVWKCRHSAWQERGQQEGNSCGHKRDAVRITKSEDRRYWPERPSIRPTAVMSPAPLLSPAVCLCYPL